MPSKHDQGRNGEAGIGPGAKIRTSVSRRNSIFLDVTSTRVDFSLAKNDDQPNSLV